MTMVPKSNEVHKWWIIN